MDNLISKEYKNKIIEKHKKGHWGGNVEKRIPDLILKYMNLSRAKSILDYGSGYGAFKEAMQGLPGDMSIHEYEPGVPGKDQDPPVCDATVCFDVLEHIEPSKIDNVLKHIYDKTRFWAILHICTIPSRNTFPDGKNLHLIIEDSAWWVKKFLGYWNVLEIDVTKGHVKLLLIKNKL